MVENTGGRSIERKAERLFVDSCLKLGGTLLEVWDPNGDKRPSSQSERDFKDDLEDFFNTASCTRFDKDIQDYYEGKSDKYRERFESRGDNRPGRPNFRKVALSPQITTLSSGGGGGLEPGIGGKVAVVTQTTDSLKSILETAVEITDAAAEAKK